MRASISAFGVVAARGSTKRGDVSTRAVRPPGPTPTTCVRVTATTTITATTQRDDVRGRANGPPRRLRRQHAVRRP